MSARTDLQEIIERAILGKGIISGARDATEAIVKAGWRPPVRVIETVEELEALPGKTVIEDGDGDPWIKAEAPLMDSWMYAGLEYSSENMFWGIRCPFRVVWEPEQ